MEMAEQLAADCRFDEEALRLNEQLLAKRPDDLSALQRKAECLEALGRFDEAFPVWRDLEESHGQVGLRSGSRERC